MLVIGYGIAGTEDYNYKCEKAQQHNKKETCKILKDFIKINEFLIYSHVFSFGINEKKATHRDVL